MLLERCDVSKDLGSIEEEEKQENHADTENIGINFTSGCSKHDCVLHILFILCDKCLMMNGSSRQVVQVTFTSYSGIVYPPTDSENLRFT